MRKATFLGLFKGAALAIDGLAFYVGGIFVREELPAPGVYGPKYDGATVFTVLMGVVFGLYALGMVVPNISAITEARAAAAALFELIEVEKASEPSEDMI